MQEYIVGFGGAWWHFFYKPAYGLCFRKKESARFGEFEILLKEATDDFCVLALGKTIHIICQDASGAILYLTYHGETWEKLTLLSSKEPKPYPKHFALIPVGSFINLYYVIEYKEKTMLIHQLLSRPEAEPTVVDYITPSARPFSVCMHSSTDLTVCYQNAQGVCGIRTYRWSQKSYTPFTHTAPGMPVFSPTIHTDTDDTCHFAALTKLESIQNLVCFRRDPDGSLTKPITVYLDCGENPQPILFRQGEKLYLQWLDGGSVMMSTSSDDGRKWKKPVKYMRGAATNVTLYHICREGKSTPCYGFSDNGAIRLYGADHPLDAPPPAPPKPEYRPRGSGAADFARQFGYRRPPEQEFDPAYVSAEEFQKELFAIRQILSKQNEMIAMLLAHTSGEPETSETPIAENEDDIDRIVAATSNPQPITDIKNMHTAKIVVTGT